MVVDYREKKNQPNSAERRAVPRNKPRRDQPLGLIAVISIVAFLASFGGGLLTGWVIFKGRKPAAPVAAVVADPKKVAEPAAGGKRPASGEPLTFYQTLPQGGKGALGSGMNLKKEEKKPAPAAPASAAAPAATAAPPGKFLVQIASYREKKEAEKIQEKLSSKGLAAYVVESKSAERGVWYRVRVGKHLSRDEADDLAETAGNGAIVVSE